MFDSSVNTEKEMRAFCLDMANALSQSNVVLDISSVGHPGSDNGKLTQHILELDGTAGGGDPRGSATYEFAKRFPVALTSILYMLMESNSIHGQKKSDSSLEKDVRLLLDVILTGYRRGAFVSETAEAVEAVNAMINNA